MKPGSLLRLFAYKDSINETNFHFEEAAYLEIDNRGDFSNFYALLSQTKPMFQTAVQSLYEENEQQHRR